MNRLKLTKLSAMVVAVMLMTNLFYGINPAQAEQFQDSEYIYGVSWTGQSTIAKYIGAGGDVAIPDALGGCPVTYIGNDAFRDCSSITSITVPATVTGIGAFAFAGCKSLTDVSLSQGLESIAPQAFSACTNLKSIWIPDSVTYIGSHAFSECTNMTSAHLSANVTSINQGTFLNCESLSSISIPENVTTIAETAFMNCGFTNIYIPKTITSIAVYSFPKCMNLTNINVDPDNANYTSIDGVLYDKSGSKLMTCPSGKTSINIPESVTTISAFSFVYDSKLTSIFIPENVKQIEYLAFQYCNQLNKFEISQNISNLFIGSQAFQFCTSLESIVFPEGVNTEGGILGECPSLKSVTYCSETMFIEDSCYSIPAQATIIGLPGSTAEAYATKYGRTFEPLSSYLPGPMGVWSIDYYSNEDVIINWVPSQNATSYNLWLKKTGTIIPYTIEKTGLTGTSYNLGKLPEGNYDFSMTQINPYGTGEECKGNFSIKKPLPGSMSVASINYYSDEDTIIYWTASDRATNYNLWVNKTDTIIPFTYTISKNELTGTSYNLGKLPEGSYEISMTPLNSYGSGDACTGIFEVTKRPLPGEITSLSVKPQYTTEENIAVNWTSATNASEYTLTVFSQKKASGPFVQFRQVLHITGNSFDLGQFEAGSYKVSVVGKNSTGDGKPAEKMFSVMKKPDTTVLSFPCKEKGWVGTIYGGLFTGNIGHTGVDFRAVDLNLSPEDVGKPVYPVADGVVYNYNPTYGELIIKHTTTTLVLKDGKHVYHTWYSKYAHMDPIPMALQIQEGQQTEVRVYKGKTELGKISDKGVSPVNGDRQYHLHFGIFTEQPFSAGNDFGNNPYTISPLWIAGLDDSKYCTYGPWSNDYEDTKAYERLKCSPDYYDYTPLKEKDKIPPAPASN